MTAHIYVCLEIRTTMIDCGNVLFRELGTAVWAVAIVFF